MEIGIQDCPDCRKPIRLTEAVTLVSQEKETMFDAKLIRCPYCGKVPLIRKSLYFGKAE